jgi:hypothetical protein
VDDDDLDLIETDGTRRSSTNLWWTRSRVPPVIVPDLREARRHHRIRFASQKGTPLTSDLIAAAVEADPRIGQHAGGYFAMTALPQTLKPAEPLARAVYRNGWRPSYAPGPTRDELVDVIHAAVPAVRPVTAASATPRETDASGRDEFPALVEVPAKHVGDMSNPPAHERLGSQGVHANTR